jgi:F0F1-type ATP synthase assembly protein I
VSYLVGLIIAFLPMVVFVGACIVLQRRRRRRRRREMMIKSLYTEPETRRFK